MEYLGVKENASLKNEDSYPKKLCTEILIISCSLSACIPIDIAYVIHYAHYSPVRSLQVINKIGDTVTTNTPYTYIHAFHTIHNHRMTQEHCAVFSDLFRPPGLRHGLVVPLVSNKFIYFARCSVLTRCQRPGSVYGRRKSGSLRAARSISTLTLPP